MPSKDKLQALESATQELQDKRKSSYATAKLSVLPTVAFKQPIHLPQTIIFLHTPKTGGTNLSFLVGAWAKLDTAYKPYRFAVPERTDGIPPNKIIENWQGGLKTAEDVLSQQPDFCEDKNFISGHFPFGLHAHIKRSTGYITLVREPVAQQLSAFYFSCQRGYETQDRLEAWLNECLDNPQTRLLAGKKCMTGACTAATLEKAKQNIQNHFLLAGVTEDTDAFIQIFASMQKRGPLAFCRAQVTGEKREVLPSETYLKVLAEKHQFDVELYAWVKERWNQWKKDNVCEIPQVIMQDQKIMCLKSEFASTRTPVWYTKEEIEGYNRSVEDTLVSVQQSHSGISTITYVQTEKIVEILKTFIPGEEPAQVVLQYLYAAHEITKPMGVASASSSSSCHAQLTNPAF